MANKNGKSNGGGKAADASQSVLGNLPSTRPTRMGRRRDSEPEAPAEAMPKAAAATAKPKAAAKPKATAAAKPKTAAKPKATTTAKPKTAAKPKATTAAKPKTATKPQATTKPRAVRSGSPSLERSGPEPDRTEPSGGPPKGTELVTTAVQAAGELAQIGLTVGGQALKRAVRRLPKP
jgi:hypothetical protein